jgi:hypothetical protein
MAQDYNQTNVKYVKAVSDQGCIITQENELHPYACIPGIICPPSTSIPNYLNPD